MSDVKEPQGDILDTNGIISVYIVCCYKMIWNPFIIISHDAP